MKCVFGMCLVRVCLPLPDHKFHEGRDLYLVPHKTHGASTALATLYVLSQCSVNEHVTTKSPGYEAWRVGWWAGGEGAWEVGSNLVFSGNRERPGFCSGHWMLVQPSVLCCISLLWVTHASPWKTSWCQGTQMKALTTLKAINISSLWLL